MFDRILIANRGEIACRIISTASRMGVETVAIYSDADSRSRHVALADHAVRIGPAQPSESYLNIGRVIGAAASAEVCAIHPGYGFLSENAEFAEAVREAGIEFIGPRPEAIRLMGRKDEAKLAMEKAGVPVVPGYSGSDQDSERLLEEADRIGFPLLIKPVDGGGGKGMRSVFRREDFIASLNMAKLEAAGAFGSDRVLIERLISRPRHIEIQIVGDTHGNAVHLYERECSLQRRFQKIVEESPAPGLSREQARRLGEISVKAAKSIGYVGAGTLEFIAEFDGGFRPDGFWFMEMNTRIQVEHPVTELTTGVDIVEWQLRIAAGEKLPALQSEIGSSGHAVEARLYAEDPGRDFLPSGGRITRLSLPNDARVDRGIDEGDAVGARYDPMVAKLIVHRETRADAIGALGKALSETEVSGFATNALFLSALTSCEQFLQGNCDTEFVERDFCPAGSDADPTDQAIAIAALAVSTRQGQLPADAGFALWASHRAKVQLESRQRKFEAEIAFPTNTSCEVRVHEKRFRFAYSQEEWTFDGRKISKIAFSSGPRVGVSLDGYWEFQHSDPYDRSSSEQSGSEFINTPVPGEVKSVRVAKGDRVEAGAEICVVESMKMEHTIAASRDGKIAEVYLKTGDSISDGAPVVRFEE